MYIQDIKTGNGGEWSKSAMLEEINRDRSDSWTPFDGVLVLVKNA